ncbi:MAG: hypothetical protein J6J44_00550, partial [Lachnospiraceae bacterium]|nr:hypothetical protein [Lachnospiraceae bacterium]
NYTTFSGRWQSVFLLYLKLKTHEKAFQKIILSRASKFLFFPNLMTLTSVLNEVFSSLVPLRREGARARFGRIKFMPGFIKFILTQEVPTCGLLFTSLSQS